MVNPVVTTGLIKAGTSLLGGLFGRKDKGPTMQQQLDFQRWQLDQERASNAAWEKERYTHLRDGALAAGFNPLTVLGATGGGSSAPSGSMAPLQVSTGGPDWGAIAASVGDDIADMIIRNDPVEQEYRQLRNELLRADIKTMQNRRMREGGPLSPDTTRENEDVHIPDPYGTRPEDMRIQHGKHKGRYVTAYNGNVIMMPKGFQPHEGREAIWGGMASEFQSMTDATLRSLPRVKINSDGTVTILNPGAEPNQTGPDTSGVPPTGPFFSIPDNNWDQPVSP